MRLHCFLLSTYLVITRLCYVNALCPSKCFCKQNEKGKRATYCKNGGMKDPIPTDHMDHGMEYLEISAPEGDWNSLPVIGQFFQKFRQLEELHISRSGVVQITMHAFWGVPSLLVLDLSNNNISGISGHNFRGLANLVELNLDNNFISELVMGVFSHMTELRILSMQHNKLNELVPRLFIKLGNLQVLKLSGNTFKELNPDVFKDILDLRVLECRGCGLRRINTQIYHLLPYLAHLDLGNNRLQYFDTEEFVDLHKIRSLKLDGNLLSVVLEKTFANQQQLRSLCLARNRLAKITDTAFYNLTSLVSLDISYNKMYKLEPISMQPIADTLQRLSISGNRFPLEVIKACLQAAYSVRNLEMADMNISDIPEGFLPERIKQLNLSGNNLSEVETLPRQLVELDLSHNKIRGLDESAVLRIEGLESAKLNDNPWACDLCHITPILLRANKSKALQVIICASPNSLKGRPVSSLRAEDIPACESERDSDNQFAFVQNNLEIILVFACLLILLTVFGIVMLYARTRRRPPNREGKQDNKIVRERAVVFDNATTIFGSGGEISFKFPLDLTEQTVSVSTIDEMKKDTQLHILPNGTGI